MSFSRGLGALQNYPEAPPRLPTPEEDERVWKGLPPECTALIAREDVWWFGPFEDGELIVRFHDTDDEGNLDLYEVPIRDLAEELGYGTLADVTWFRINHVYYHLYQHRPYGPLTRLQQYLMSTP